MGTQLQIISTLLKFAAFMGVFFLLITPCISSLYLLSNFRLEGQSFLDVIVFLGRAVQNPLEGLIFVLVAWGLAKLIDLVLVTDDNVYKIGQIVQRLTKPSDPKA